MKIELEFVEYDANYVTVTDAMSSIHYLFHHHFNMNKIKNAQPGDKVEVEISLDDIDSNGIVEI